MKHHLQQLIVTAIGTLEQSEQLSADPLPDIKIERARDKQHGDFACNVAMMLAKRARCQPRVLAEQIVAALPVSQQVAKVVVAGPGFINFFMRPAAFQQGVNAVLDGGEAYGFSTIGNGRSVQVEFVSANPTGPLHVGHGRGAAYGAAVADLLVAAGFAVHREYYVNDAGRQMNILAVSLWLRYLERCGEQLPFPVAGYRGHYIGEIAGELFEQHGDRFCRSAEEIISALPADETAAGQGDRKSTRLNSSHTDISRMPSSA